MKNALKMISLALMLIAVFAPKLQAQDANAKVSYSKVVEASADDVWTLVRQMDDIDKYSQAIGKVNWSGDHGVGGQRICLPPKGKEGKFIEEIVAFSDNERSYSYKLIEGVPAQGMVNTFKVVDLGYNRSMIVWTSSYQEFLQNPDMTEEQFMGFLNMNISEMVAKLGGIAEKS